MHIICVLFMCIYPTLGKIRQKPLTTSALRNTCVCLPMEFYYKYLDTKMSRIKFTNDNKLYNTLFISFT